MLMLILLTIFAVNYVHGQNTACESGVYNNQYGICLLDESCCKGTLVSNLCGQYGGRCCYGVYDCTNPTPNTTPNPNGNTQGNGRCPTIIRRSEWSASPPIRAVNTLPLNVPHVFIHHTDDGASCYNRQTCSVRLRSLQSYHQKSKNWADIAWQFLISGDGTVYEGLGWGREGFHTFNYNPNSLGIAFIGNFETTAVPSAMQIAAQNLISCAVTRGEISSSYRLHGHRDARITACPGQTLYNIISQWRNFQPGPLPGYS